MEGVFANDDADEMPPYTYVIFCSGKTRDVQGRDDKHPCIAENLRKFLEEEGRAPPSPSRRRRRSEKTG